MSKSKLPLIVTGVFLLGVFCVQAMAQQADNTGGPGGPGGPGDQNLDPAQMRQQMMDRMKESLGVSDDEWKVIQPKLEKVMTLSRDARGGGMGMRGPGGPDDANQPAPEPQTEVGKANQALGKVLENKNAKPEEIKAALQAFRDAKAKAKTQLEAAQKELREVLTVRQEVLLVQRGTLD